MIEQTLFANDVYILYLFIVFCLGLGIILWRKPIIQLTLIRILNLLIALPLLFLRGKPITRGSRKTHVVNDPFSNSDYITKKFPTLDEKELSILIRLVSKMDNENRNKFFETCVEVEGGHIISLNLSDEDLTSLPPEICSLYYLKRLFLRFNKIKSLPPNIGYLKNLEVLDLRENQIHSLPTQFRALEKLEKLDMSYNQLERFPQWESGLPNLIRLNLNNNSLFTVLESIGNMKDLEILYLQNNQISFLPESVQSLKKLWYLDIRNNQLISIPPNLINSQNLKEFHFDKDLG